MCAGTGVSVSFRLSVNSSNHSGRSRKRSPVACLSLFVLFLFCDVVESRRFPGACSSLRCSSGLEEVLDESCSGDVEDELVPELDDNPGTTRGTTFSVLHHNSFPFFVNRGPCPLDHSQEYPFFFAELSK